MCGDNGRQLETREDQTGQTIQQKETKRETMRDKVKHGEARGGKGRQGETRPRKGGHIIQQVHTCG